MSPKLKDCPFCGHAAKPLQTVFGSCAVICGNEGCPLGHGDTDHIPFGWYKSPRTAASLDSTANAVPGVPASNPHWRMV